MNGHKTVEPLKPKWSTPKTLAQAQPLSVIRRGTLKLAYALAGDRRLVAQGVFWRILGKKVRAHNALAKAAAKSAWAYRYWIRFVEPTVLFSPSPVMTARVSERIKVVVVQDGKADPALAFRSARSVIAALGAEPSIVTIRGGDALEEMALIERLMEFDAAPHPSRSECLSYHHLLLLHAGDCLHPNFVTAAQGALQANADAALIYWDEDECTERDVRCRPWFKPDWDSLQFLSQDYISGSCMINFDALRDLARTRPEFGASPWQITNAVVLQNQRPGSIVHIPHVLTHKRRGGSAAHDPQERAKLLKHFLPGTDQVVVDTRGNTRVIWTASAPSPSVSVIIPTRDQLPLLAACVEGVRHARWCGKVDIIIVDNGSTEAATVSYLADQRRAGITVLDCAGPFNFAALNNGAVDQAKGEYICFMNNDVEPCDDEWLIHLLRYAMRPESGAVGAKLLYPDGSIQHAGVTIGTGGAAGHMHRYLPNSDHGYFHHPHIARYCSAVTAACMVVNKAKFLEVGGFDTENFPVAFNDVDLCLRLERAGWKNVYVPEAQLVHHESKSRGNDMAPANRERYFRELGNLQRIWGTQTYLDPYLNRNLSRAVEQMMVDLK